MSTLLTLTLAGCPKTVPTEREVHDLITPLEPESRAAVPDAADGPAVAVARGQGEGFVWAHSNAAMETDAANACDQLRPARVVNTGSIARYVPQRTEDGFLITNHVERPIISFEFDIRWRVRHDEDGGCEARWDLTRAPAFLRRNRGWLRISPQGEHGTLLEMQHELAAPRVSPNKPAAYLETLHERIAELTQE